MLRPVEDLVRRAPIQGGLLVQDRELVLEVGAEASAEGILAPAVVGAGVPVFGQLGQHGPKDPQPDLVRKCRRIHDGAGHLVQPSERARGKHDPDTGLTERALALGGGQAWLP